MTYRLVYDYTYTLKLNLIFILTYLNLIAKVQSLEKVN